jgi:hypothetical protein
MVRNELKIQEVATLVRANRSKMADEIAAAGISHGTWHKILSYDLSMSCVTQHSVPRLSKRSWQNNRSPFCHTLYTHKATWASISVG